MLCASLPSTSNCDADIEPEGVEWRTDNVRSDPAPANELSVRSVCD